MVTTDDKINVAIFLFDGIEVLDFAGPFEVFSRTRLVPGLESRRNDESAPFRVLTVAATAAPIVATGGLRVIPEYAFETMPPAHILVVPGGWGTRPLLGDEGVLEWIRSSARSARLVTSVCSGALLLARAGILSGKRATTHWGALGTLAELDPTITVDGNELVVRDGVITSAGISAGIDMSLSVVEDLFGSAVANDTATYMEYDRRVTNGSRR